MNRHTYTLLLLVAVTLAACSDDVVQTSTPSPEPLAQTLPQDAQPGMMSIKLDESVLSQIDNSQTELALPTGCVQLDDYLLSIGATRLRRIFPDAGRLEQRQQAEHLNAWYTVWFDRQTPVTRAVGSVDESSVVSYAEPVVVPRLERHAAVRAQLPATRAAGDDSPYDDPYFSWQWPLQNRGTFGNYTTGKGEQVVSSIAGADISALDAWQQVAASSRVVVAVVDGGIDTEHEDLVENMWRNPGEIEGNGIDDDNNGYVDDVYGWNFVDDSPVIIATDHGTHVAGIVAARNNNGLGLSSIAGGDGSPETGAKLMSCQIFKPNPDYDPDDEDSRETISVETYNAMAAAIVYGANNGALISQNSWGFSDYEEAPLVVKEAIAYFNRYAGHFEGSLMKGGITIFSAGNEATESMLYPAAYDDVVAVAAYAPDWAASWYTNYGQWVDICAPGGSNQRGDKYPLQSSMMPCGILSTLPQTDAGGSYGFMVGTSMACPFVSGIAALVVSKFGGEGFTSGELRQRLLTGVRPVATDDYNTARYRDRLGAGYADAAAALEDYDTEALPPMPTFLTDESKPGYNSISLVWTADIEKAGQLQYFTLYYSQQAIRADALDAKGVGSYTIPAGYATAGVQRFSRQLSGLGNEQTYYFALTATSRGGKTSPAALLDGGLTTLLNTPPTITPDVSTTETLKMAGNDVVDIFFTITDREQHAWTYELTGAGNFYSEERPDGLLVRLFANKFGTGTHRLTLTVEDEYKAQAELRLTLEKVADKVPSLKAGAPLLVVTKGHESVYDLRTLIDDEEPESLTFEAGPMQNDVARMAIADGSMLTLWGKTLGTSALQLNVTDRHAQMAALSLPILVAQGEVLLGLYPTEAVSVLQVALSSELKGNFTLRIRNSAGKTVKEEHHSAAELQTPSAPNLPPTVIVDVSKLYPGRYDLSLLAGGKTYTQTFIKL